MDLTTLTNALVATLQPATQKQSEDFLGRAEVENFPEYLKALATILADPSRPPLALRVAGVILKNAFFDSRSEQARIRKYHIWNTMVDESLRQYIRECVLRGLVSPVEEARKSAAQVVGALGVLELGEKRWPEMISTLCQNATSPQIVDAIKVSTLEAMGYLCETLDPSLVNEQLTNALLTAIVENMKTNKVDSVRLSAITALLNTLDFASVNMNRQNERDYIVASICECARAPKFEIRCVAFDCLRKIVERYYSLLSNEYIEALYHLTATSVKAAGTLNNPSQRDDEQVALHAIEVWCTLCEQEIDLVLEMRESQNNGDEMPPERQSKKFIQRALVGLVEMITTVCLTKQSEELTDDEDEWNLSMSGGTLLGLIAQCEGDSILKVVMPFVQKNLPVIGKENWRFREAGLMAFGKVLDGPDSSELAPWIREGIEFFLPLLDPEREPVPQVRDTAAWAVGCICEFHVETIHEFLPRIVLQLMMGLRDPIALVAATNAEAILKLALSFSDDAEKPSNKLSPFLSHMLPKLMETTARPDWEEGELRGGCFEAINAVVVSCALDGYPIIASLLDEVLRKLTVALSANIQNQQQKDEVNNMIQYCCGTLLVIVQKLRSQLSAQQQTIMALLFRILETHNGVALMDAHMVIGAVARALGLGFRVYYKNLIPYILRGLENSEDYQVCQTATELVSDISNAIHEAVFDDSRPLMTLLLQNLANQEINKVVKPTTISAIGDMALALNEKYEPYADAVLNVLASASMYTVPKDDQDMVDYLNELRESILDAYTSILQALGPAAAARQIAPRLDDILNFLVMIARDVEYEEGFVTESVVKGAVGVLGDLCKVLGPAAQHKIKSAISVFGNMVEICINSEDADTNEVGLYFKRLVL